MSNTSLATADDSEPALARVVKVAHRRHFVQRRPPILAVAPVQHRAWWSAASWLSAPPAGTRWLVLSLHDHYLCWCVPAYQSQEARQSAKLARHHHAQSRLEREPRR